MQRKFRRKFWKKNKDIKTQLIKFRTSLVLSKREKSLKIMGIINLILLQNIWKLVLNSDFSFFFKKNALFFSYISKKKNKFPLLVQFLLANYLKKLINNFKKN